jgi:riboflavin kinase/FMN adenylyltransferase
MGTYMPQKKVFEAHIFDFDADIYGQEIEVILLQKIRDNQKFASLEDLKAQIKKDQKEILSHTLNVLSFGSFDVVHP